MSDESARHDSGYTHAPQEFCAFLYRFAERGGPLHALQRIVTLNASTPLPIARGKPRYNTFALRAYGDLTVDDAGGLYSKTAPEDVIDVANCSDSWSGVYCRFLFENLQAKIRAAVDRPAAIERLAALLQRHADEWMTYVRASRDVEMSWESHQQKSGLLEEADPKVFFRAKNDFTRRSGYHLQSLFELAAVTSRQVRDLERAQIDSAMEPVVTMRDKLVRPNWERLPSRPELEQRVDSDVMRSPADYDERLSLCAAGGPEIFARLLARAADCDDAEQFRRGYTVIRNNMSPDARKTSAFVQGDAQKMVLFKAKLSFAESRTFKQQLGTLERFQVGFRAIDEIVLLRGDWYSASFLNSAEVRGWLAREPACRDKLSRIITSLIVCRGVTVKLEFSDDIDQTSWRDLKEKSPDSINVGGFEFGLRGLYGKHTPWSIKDITNRSVTFADGPDVCRVLGFRTEQILEQFHSDHGGSSVAHCATLREEAVSEYQSGRIGYAELLEKVDVSAVYPGTL